MTEQVTTVEQVASIICLIGLFAFIVISLIYVISLTKDEKPPKKPKKIKNVVYLKEVTDPTPGKRYYTMIDCKMEEVVYICNETFISGEVRHMVYVIKMDLIRSTVDDIYDIYTRA